MRAGRLVLCSLALLLFSLQARAVQYAFQVSFKDKRGTTGTLANPLAYLSQRALDRRNAQGLSVDSTDLPVSHVYVDSVLTLTNGILHLTSRWLNFCVILVPDSTGVPALLSSQSFVTDVKWVGYYSTQLHNRPGRDTAQPKTTGSSSYYGDTWVQTRLVNGDCLHDQGYKGEGKLIAVLDAGFADADTHPGFDSLRQSGRLLDTHNFVLATTNVYGYDIHGTECLSSMAGNMPGTYIGSAPYASYALYVTEAPGEMPIELANLVAGTERADSLGADVVSESLGYNTFDAPFDAVPPSLQLSDIDGKTTIAAKAANMATSKGMLFVASAGNEGGDSWNSILTPGDADSALTVGSVDVNGTPAGNSGYGPNAAGQVKPDVVAMGVLAYLFYYSGAIINDNGTSFSTPQVAGWATCLWQAAGNVTPYQLRVAISKGADHYTNPGQQIGYGIPDFCKAQQFLNVLLPPGSAADWVKAGPNPFNSELSININLSTSQDISISMFDVAGKLIANFKQRLSKGTNNFALPVSSSLPQGIYFLKVSGAEQRKVIKLEKL